MKRPYGCYFELAPTSPNAYRSQDSKDSVVVVVREHGLVKQIQTLLQNVWKVPHEVADVTLGYLHFSKKECLFLNKTEEFSVRLL